MDICNLPNPGNQKSLQQTAGVWGFRKFWGSCSTTVWCAEDISTAVVVWAGWRSSQQLREVMAYELLGPLHAWNPFALTVVVRDPGAWWGLWQQVSQGEGEWPMEFGSKPWQAAQSVWEVLLRTYLALMDTENVSQNRKEHLKLPLCILKPTLEGQPFPAGWPSDGHATISFTPGHRVRELWKKGNSMKMFRRSGS